MLKNCQNYTLVFSFFPSSLGTKKESHMGIHLWKSCSPNKKLEITKQFWSKILFHKDTPGVVHKRGRIFLAVFDTPLTPCRNFDPDIPDFYLLKSNFLQHLNLRPPSRIKYSDLFFGWPSIALQDFVRKTLPSACWKAQRLATLASAALTIYETAILLPGHNRHHNEAKVFLKQGLS